MQTPEHDKMHEVKERSQAIGEFIEWLGSEEGVSLTVHREKRWVCFVCGVIDEDDVRASRAFCGEDGCRLCLQEGKESAVEHQPEGYYPYHFTIEKLLAKHFDIDLNKVEDEKRAMLDELRTQNAG
jgi:hypothetical protein